MEISKTYRSRLHEASIQAHSRLAVENVVVANNGTIVAWGRGLFPTDLVRVSCANGHIWAVSMADLIKGKWCALCSVGRKLRERSFQALSAKVEKLGALVVTDFESYRGVHTFVSLRCSLGHEWSMKASTILFAQKNVTKENFCQVCSPRRNAKKSLELLKEVARKNGGECLATSYPNQSVKLPWRCANGHEWMSTGQIILGGSWCPTCCHANAAHGMDALHALANERGGKCISERYGRSNEVYDWECRQGHRFQLSFYYAAKGAWCPSCERIGHGALRLEELRSIARSKGGECLSPVYEGRFHKLNWRCSRGHEWSASPGNIFRGSWCPDCFRSDRFVSLEEFQKLAEEKGGQCLSDKVTTLTDRLRFRCKEGHEWEFVARTMRKGAWCPVCDGRVKTLEEMQEVARSRGGKCLSPSYRGLDKPLLWQCKIGHQWRAAPQSLLKQGSWCRQCAYGSYSFAELVEKAKSKGGQVLSSPSEYKNGQSLLRVKCREEHSWEIRATALGQGSWCRKCGAQRRRMPLEEISAYAESHGGALLTEKMSTHSKNWVYLRCGEGHVWRARGDQVVRAGTWCRKCRYESRKLTVEDLRAMAAKKGGECLSKRYLGGKEKHQWRCSAGHTWWTTPAIIQHGSWCVKCTSSKVNSYEKLDAIVKSRGGEILSKEYLGSAQKHEFRCKVGHKWWTTPSSIVSGRWCHACAGCEDGSIEKLQKVAKKFGGKCLSTEYRGSKEKHLWECKAGHQFWKKPNHVMARGQWCKECRSSVR